jgi:hypothetical protein
VAPREPSSEASIGKLDELGARVPVLCASCRAALTHAELRREVDGAHEHTFFNAAGVVYTLRCFESAPGTRTVGDPVLAFSWFAGWAWQIGLCGRCGAHVGWRWEKGGASFVGLVTTAILVP